MVDITPDIRYALCMLMSEAGKRWIENEVAQGRIDKRELDICIEADEANDPNVFLGYFTLRGDTPQQYCPHCECQSNLCKSPNSHRVDWYTSGLQLWKWQTDILTGNVMDVAGNPAHTVVIVGGPGCGKSLLLAAFGAMWCALNAGFYYICPAPTGVQNEAVMREHNKFFGEGTRFYHTFQRKDARAQPLQIEYANGSLHQLFTTAALAGGGKTKRNLGKEGDAAAYDEAGIDPTFAKTMHVIGSRLRGTRMDGNSRGITMSNGDLYTYLMIISNPHPDNAQWDNFVQFARRSPGFAVREVGIQDNKIFTPEQDRAMTERTIAWVIADGGDLEDAYSILAGKQEGAYGGEFFTKPILDKVIDGNYDVERHVISPLYKTGETGYYVFGVPPIDGHLYAIAVDPGVSKAPSRNAPVIGVWDITEIENIILVAMYWGSPEAGEDVHYITQLKSWMRKYACNAAIDTTGPQVMILQHRLLADVKERLIPINFAAGQKASAQIALQEDCGAGAITVPSNLYIRKQLRRYTWADSKKIPQDIVSMILVMNTWRRSLAYSRSIEMYADEQSKDIIQQRQRTARHGAHEPHGGHNG